MGFLDNFSIAPTIFISDLILWARSLFCDNKTFSVLSFWLSMADNTSEKFWGGNCTFAGIKSSKERFI